MHVKGVRSHAIVRQALQLLVNLLHRGACGCEVNTGDGAGILIQMPDKFLRKEARQPRYRAAASRRIRRGCVFLPRDPAARATIEALIERDRRRRKDRRCSDGAICRPTIGLSARRRRRWSRTSGSSSSGRGSDPFSTDRRRKAV